jgi:hypothetical protein
MMHAIASKKYLREPILSLLTFLVYKSQNSRNGVMTIGNNSTQFTGNSTQFLPSLTSRAITVEDRSTPFFSSTKIEPGGQELRLSIFQL